MNLNKKLFIFNIILIIGLIILQLLDILTTYFLVPYTELVYEGNPFMVPQLDNHFFVVMFKIFPVIMFSISNLCCYFLSIDSSLGIKFLISTGILLVITCIIIYCVVLNNSLIIVFLIDNDQISVF